MPVCYLYRRRNSCPQYVLYICTGLINTAADMASAFDLQEQTLTFFSGNESSLLAAPNSLTLIAHDSTNSPTWLTTAIIQQALSTLNECYLAPHSPSIDKNAIPAFLFSFTNTEQTYNKYFLKYLTKNKDQFTFTSFLAPHAPAVEDWYTHIVSSLKKQSTPSIVIIEHPELLLSIVPGMTPIKLLSCLHEIQRLSTLYVVTTTSTSSGNTATLLPSLLHRSSLIVSLTALNTGRADDISGTLATSIGPINTDKIGQKNIEERHYSYQVNANAVKMYYK